MPTVMLTRLTDASVEPNLPIAQQQQQQQQTKAAL